MRDTRDKLSEAEFFLERMRESQSDRDAFRYNLSAFLGAARSVRDFLHKEYENLPHFKEWWTEKGTEWGGIKGTNKMSPDELLAEVDKISDPDRGANAFFDAVRIITIHRQSVRPRRQVDVGMVSKIALSSSMEAVVIHADGTIGETRSLRPPTPTPTPVPSETTVEERWYFERFPQAVAKRDVIALSEEHIARLDALVTECEAKFRV